jgi:tetratricopeptide (TPR) repeat protein
LKLNPNDKTGWHNKGLALEKLGKPEDALKCFDIALELDPTFEPALKAKKDISDGKIE